MRADDLLILVEVARSGSLLRAAESLGVDHSTISRRLAELDRQMGSPTVVRSVTGSRLTELGEALLGPADRIEQGLDEAQRLAQDGPRGRRFSGLLRVSTVEGFGATFVTPALARLQQQHPGLSAEIVTGTRPVPQSISADIEVAVGAPVRRHAHQYLLSPYHLALYASADYLRERGTPQSLAELHDHPLIYYVEAAMRVEDLVVIDKYFPDHAIGLSSPNVFVQTQATVAGAGIGILPAFLARQHPELRQILPREFAVSLEFYASIADRPTMRPASEALLEQIRREIALRGHELVLAGS